ncbi:glucosamine--fructose-6-phosphate aminotransferase (isomerizing) [Bacilli bacterium PM5-3]|nr:glucosamine--fructose-6-phosphate aminotransferase (isomerizing) [Bacilli bacterium PM5-3]MDH6604096.1 glucosamine--fructose-6-phosphate aminotransferase (isomerizing) [Bacilli bacterium PM5-9]
MCGIVGYVGEKNAKDIIISGLKTLEYRGYDSSGIAFVIDNKIDVYREIGRISNLEKLIKDVAISNIGIGHTRWATHGKPSKENSHPHTSMNSVITLVHNGVIENFAEIKEDLINKGYTFKSETDTEVIANFLEDDYKKTTDMKQSIINMMKVMHGAYALGILCADEQDTLYCVKNKTPMLAGVGNNFNMIGSDAMAMINETNKFIEINDLEFLIVKKDDIKIYDKDGQQLNREPFISNVNATDINLGTYEHYMLKEIDEQPTVIRNLLSEYLTNGKLNIDANLINEIKMADRLYIIASGTSMHAGLVGKFLIEELANKPVEVHLGSEFGYHMPLISENPLFIFITQSGETADSRVALKLVKEKGYKALTITNVEGSTLSREADYTLLLHAGPEIAVASTKAYVAQVTLLSLIANELSGNIIDVNLELSKVITAIEDIISRKEIIRDIVQDKIVYSRNCFYIGRNLDYFVALEAALKLKEISYIQTEGFASGELKHGTIALIESATPVVALISQEKVALNTRSAIQEVKAREAMTTIISQQSVSKEEDDFIVNDTHHLFSPIAMVVVTQLISYYAALEKGYDIDKPRNLAKSVTVE